MRRILGLLVLAGFFLFPSLVLAFDFKPAGLTPLSPWYFLETGKEEIVLFFTFSSVQKVDKLIQLSSEKMSEINEVLNKDSDKALVSILRAQNLLSRVKKVVSGAKKDKVFAEKRVEWQEILAQELVFLTEKRGDLQQADNTISLIKEVRQVLK
ncbi:hypothetical protein J7K05_00035 [bacterium]|nr:hypothetical protein [bacterium]